VIAYPTSIEASKGIYKYKVNISDGTCQVTVLYNMHTDSAWIHSIRYRLRYIERAAIINLFCIAEKV
jgi:hypothetical protein